MAQTSAISYLEKVVHGEFYDRFNDFQILLPMIKVITLLIAVPVILMLIYRVERMQVKFKYHYEAANKEFVQLNTSKQDKSREGEEAQMPPIFDSKNNFSLVSGHGRVTALDNPVLRDELFGLPFENALRLHRRVEVLHEYKGIAESEDSSDKQDSSDGYRETIMQAWVEVSTEG